MVDIEVYYFAGCPSYKRALVELKQILAKKKLKAKIKIIEVKNNADAKKWKFFGSPTIRIDGREVDPQTAKQFSLGCRIYLGPKGIRDIPFPEMYERAIKV